MTKRIAKGRFVLTLPTGEKKEFCAGEEITGEHADHWWVQAHSMEVDPKVEAARLAEQAADSEELQQLRDENAQLRVEVERLRAESASTSPAAADQKKKKDDKDSSSK